MSLFGDRSICGYSIQAVITMALWLLASHQIEPIHNGIAVQQNNVSFMVAIFGQSNLICGGIVLTELHVLTACRCLKFKDQPLESANATIYPGHTMVDYTNTIFVHNIEMTYCHDEYNPETHENDIGVIKMTKNFRFKDSIRVGRYIAQSCLPLTPVKYETNECVTFGWGMTESGTQAIQLQQANISIASDSVCSKASGSYNRTSMICAGTEKEAKISNYGDSGGPLACPIKNKPESYAIVGVAFQGQDAPAQQSSSENVHMPGYYTKVEPFVKWLKNVVDQS